MGRTGPATTASVTGTVALVVLFVLLMLVALRWGSPDQPLAEPSTHTSTAAETAALSSPSAATDPSSPATSATERGDDRRRGAIARVPREVILRQLARAAERIAQDLPMPALPVDVDPGSNRALGYHLMVQFGFAPTQWRYLDALWTRESGWDHLAENPSSGAYGIPQSLPGTKMAVVGPDWRTNPDTQIRWGLAYIAARYGNPQGAWAHSERVGWY